MTGGSRQGKETAAQDLAMVLEVDSVCLTLCHLLNFTDVRELSSVCRRSAAITHTRINFFARAKLSVPTFLCDDKLREFVAGIRVDALPFITCLRLRTDVRLGPSSAFSGVSNTTLAFSSAPSRAAWSHFPNLETLDLSGYFSAPLDPSIWDLPRLTSLDLSSTIGIDLALVTRLPSLRHVFVNNTLVGTGDLVHLAPLTALETLEMTTCRFVDSLAALTGLTNLRRLRLGDGEMALRDFAGFDAFTQLRHFAHIGRGSGPREPLVDLPLCAPELASCDVSRTRLRDAAFLRHSLKLEHLDISGTGLRADVPFGCLERLQVLIVSLPLPADAAFFAPLASLMGLKRVVIVADRQQRSSFEFLAQVRAVFPASVHSLIVLS